MSFQREEQQTFQGQKTPAASAHTSFQQKIININSKPTGCILSRLDEQPYPFPVGGGKSVSNHPCEEKTTITHETVSILTFSVGSSSTMESFTMYGFTDCGNITGQVK